MVEYLAFSYMKWCAHVFSSTFIVPLVEDIVCDYLSLRFKLLFIYIFVNTSLFGICSIYSILMYKEEIESRILDAFDDLFL